VSLASPSARRGAHRRPPLLHLVPRPRPSPCSADAGPEVGAGADARAEVGPDVHADVEHAVDRVARLVLHAHALAVRTQGLPAPSADRDRRLVRLSAEQPGAWPTGRAGS
jgi:hypothetical protein